MLTPTAIATLSAIEDNLRLLPEDMRVEMNIRFTVHNDVPNGFVETSCDRFEKVIAAKNGMKTITMSISLPS